MIAAGHAGSFGGRPLRQAAVEEEGFTEPGETGADTGPACLPPRRACASCSVAKPGSVNLSSLAPFPLFTPETPGSCFWVGAA